MLHIIPNRFTTLLMVIGSLACGLQAADLTDPKNANLLSQWGYLNVVAYGADPTGKRDSTKEIQQAIDDASSKGLGLLVPLGTYIISDTLRCYKSWAKKGNKSLTPFPKDCHVIVGDNHDGKRPLIKLAVTATKFDDADKPRAMIAYACFQTDRAWSPDEINALDPIQIPLGVNTPPGGVVNRCMAVFDETLSGIDFDCSGHPGGVGIYFPSAQKCVLTNVRVIGEGAHTGIWGIPGRNSGAMNIEVQGGKYGLNTSSALAGATVIGLTLSGQTERALIVQDFVPLCVVGFHIKKKSAPLLSLSGEATAQGTLALIDGKVEVEHSGVLVDNQRGKGFYARNVYVKGSSTFIQSGSRKGVGGTGDWYKVTEYCYTDQSIPQDAPLYKVNDKRFRTFSVVNGVVSREPEPAVAIEDGVRPPLDLIGRHLLDDIPQISFRDSAKTRNIMLAPYNAVADSRDNWAAIQQAINDAENDGGGVVYVPKGTFLISKTLVLKAKTKLIGLGPKRNPDQPLSVIAAHPSWQKSPEHTALICTLDDPEAETFLGTLNLDITDNVSCYIHWRAGRKSTMMNLGFPKNGTVAESTIYFSGNGGGRHYLLEPQSPFGSKEHRHVRIVGTSQPLSWYGCNLEAGGKVAANMEIVDARNIRIFGIKREGRSPTLILNNCHNIGIHTQGAMREALAKGSGGYVQVRGASDGLLMSLMMVQLTKAVSNGDPLSIEALDGKPKVSVTWPESISLYKRGELDDSKMYLNP